MSDYLKNVIDAVFVGTSIASIISNVIPIIVGVLTIAWGIYRLYDLHLAVKLKRKELGE